MSLNVTLLKQTFAKIRVRPQTFTTSFYNNLFKEHSDVKILFALAEMKKQKEHLMNALMLIVDNLERPDVLKEALKRLGKRHVNYGALVEDYPLIGACLLKTMESFFGKDWTPEVQQAWIEAYGAIASIMLEGAKERSSRSSSKVITSSDINNENGSKAIPIAKP